MGKPQKALVEIQDFKDAKADVVHFSFEQMMMTTEINLAQVNSR